LLKSLGLQIGAIRDVIECEASTQVMSDILAEQDRKLENEIEQRQHARDLIARMTQGLEERNELPAESISGMEEIMQNDKSNEQQLRNVYRTLAGTAVPVSAIELAALAHWIRKGDRKPFLGVELLVLPLALALVRFYRERVAFLCPHCHHVLQPEARKWFLAMHTPTTRKLTCSHCATTDWCTEVAAARLNEA
jgi:hypothetical protein